MNNKESILNALADGSHYCVETIVREVSVDENVIGIKSLSRKGWSARQALDELIAEGRVVLINKRYGQAIHLHQS